MKKLTYIFALLTCFSIACTSEDKLPEGILNDEQMINLIVDLETDQSMYKLKFANKDTVSFNQLAADTFKKQNISKTEFNTSLVYYASYPKLLESFYEKAIVILSEKQASIQPTTSK